jgi:integrase
MHGAALGLDVDTDAVAKAKALLGHQNRNVEHIGAIAWSDVPAFYRSLATDNVGELALRLLMLTGVRSAPLRFLHEDHIDGDVWTIPARLMKGRRGETEDFRVPLTPEALAVIAEARKAARDGLLFPGNRKGAPISDMAMSMVMRRRELDARPHGFRSSLRDWIAEVHTDTPHEIAELMLAHRSDNKVVRSYRRTDFLDQRRALLEKWADHVTGHAVEEERVAA